MAISVKLALAICLVCIAAGSWYLPYVAVRPVQAPSVLVARDYSSERGLTRTADWTSPSQGVGGRARVGHQLQRPNPLETEVVANRSQERPLVLVPVSESARMELPPLAFEPAPVVAEAPVEPPVLAVNPASDVNAIIAPPLLGESATGAVTSSYRVAKGDSLAKIGWQKYRSYDPRIAKALSALNPDVARRNGRLLVGEELQIPDAASLEQFLAGPAAVAAAVRVAESDAAVGNGVAETGGERWYTIQRNDSLTGIARRHLDDPARWREILKLNRSLDPNKILPGMRIKLPVPVRMAAR